MGLLILLTPIAPIQSPADSNENRIPDILESKANKLYNTSQTQDANIAQTQSEASQVKPTQDQIVVAFILQNVRDAIGRGEATPSIQRNAPQTEIS